MITINNPLTCYQEKGLQWTKNLWKGWSPTGKAVVIRLNLRATSRRSFVRICAFISAAPQKAAGFPLRYNKSVVFCEGG
jgi:hypothetical protein